MAMNYNQAMSTNFMLEIPGMEILNYFVQVTELPGMNIAGIRNDYRNHQGYVQGNKIEYDMLSVSFLVDENYDNHQQLHLWMHRMQTGTSKLITEEMRDLSLHALTSNKTNGRVFKFYSAFPSMVSPLPFSTDTTDTMPIVCTVSFFYQYYERL